ncbi:MULTISPECIES: MarR family winged helix-turn-helix transcriptional regulator [Hyphomonas]|uniref:MarR family transcriptional regulator n=1 Tax=Hyphomonas adhaerens TaxID=81029 RepID=A0A3B9H3H0_9PROT|nr:MULTISPECIES: MarR family transcriptional regulator [Hyphomonas]MBB40356.1 MarR family transcriptional regulator [Hyphomonas sp.]HAE29217.1 MarR family transcriptional regulator [Hyphomonas adhaerens]
MSKRSEDALIALRKIQRITELSSKRLAVMAGLTPSQLSVLRILTEYPEVSAGHLAKATQLKHATITSLIDKLEARSLIARRRCDEDKRRVWLRLLPAGKTALADAPDPLHQIFSERFNALPDWQQAMLIASLEQVTNLLDAEDLEAAPMLDVGELDKHPL